MTGHQPRGLLNIIPQLDLLQCVIGYNQCMEQIMRPAMELRAKASEYRRLAAEMEAEADRLDLATDAVNAKASGLRPYVSQSSADASL